MAQDSLLRGLPERAANLNYRSLEELASNLTIKKQIGDFLRAIEQLCEDWNLIDVRKYQHRTEFHGTHNDAVSQVLPRKLQPAFQIQTLITAVQQPCGTTRKGDKISKADREYFYHAAKLCLRFHELAELVKVGLKTEIE